MKEIENLIKQRQQSLAATASGQPNRTSNQFFGVGPITNMVLDEVDARMMRYEFDAWIEKNYPKLDDHGNKVGNLTTAELSRGMHRGYPADKVLLDMMQQIHRYFGFAKSNKLAVGLGGGHSGFTVCALHLINANEKEQYIYMDTPKPETDQSIRGGFFRQSWASQLIELQRFAKNGDENRIHFSDIEGDIPSANHLIDKKIKLFFGVGHETTGASTYSEQDIKNLLEWIDANPKEHHAVIDATSMLGAMPWQESLVSDLMKKCSLFMPFQKAIGGVSGYFVISLTEPVMDLIEANQKQPSWSIPRQLKIAIPIDIKKPLSSEKTLKLGPIYDPNENKMLGGIINTFSTLAFAETTFGLLKSEALIGSVSVQNQRSVANRETVNQWVSKHDLFELSVSDKTRRGTAVTLLKVVDNGISDLETHQQIVAKSKQLLGYEGITHPNGDFEPGLDVARYINAFPGTPGDYRAWIGGVRPTSDIEALLDNIHYAYHRAKIVVLEEILDQMGVQFECKTNNNQSNPIKANRAYKGLIRDLIANPDQLRQMRQLSEAMSAFWGALDATKEDHHRERLIEKYASEMVCNANRLTSLLAQTDLETIYRK